MKTKLFPLILALILFLTGCASSLGKTATEPSTETRAETKTESETPQKRPDTFSTGFARGAITPALPVTLGSNERADKVLDDLLATCIAVWDGENAALIFAMDTKDIPKRIMENCAKQIEKATGVPEERIIMNGTHTHNCPHTSKLEDPACIAWQQKVYRVTAELAEKALADLAPTTLYTGRGDTTGFAFTRRYVMADGTFKGIHSANPSKEYLAHESEADPELRTIRFEREGKKDIILTNWQCHAASSGSAHRGMITADFVGALRTEVEKDGVLFAYFNGASGNIGTHKSYVKESKFDDHMKMGVGLADVVRSAVASEKKVESGKVVCISSTLSGSTIRDSAERIEQAKECLAATDSLQGVLLTKYGFPSQYEPIAISMRSAMAETHPIPLRVIAFGDVAFAANPFEMFDSDGAAIRAGSPFDTTFICAYSLDSLGYLPSSAAYPHGEYEVYVTRFVQGTSDQVVAESIRMLEQART